MQQKAFRSAATRLDRSSNFELFAWFFMRVSGIILLFIVLFHLYYMHFVVGVADIDFYVIAERWNGPMGIVWRTFDLALLLFSFTHGANGVRYVMEDYIHNNAWRVAAKTRLSRAKKQNVTASTVVSYRLQKWSSYKTVCFIFCSRR